MKQLRQKLSYANVIATLALFLALGGGAWAATGMAQNSVGTRQLRHGAVTAGKIRLGSLLASDFAPGQLRGGPGPQGETGERGARGERGPQGETGEAGDPGARGLQGPQGEAGEAGEAGERGPRGVPGAQGETGQRGEAGATGPEGEVGPRGPRGERGEQGHEGEAGERGARGPKGEAGESGFTRILTRYGPEVSPSKFGDTSYAACRKGELVSGGGFDLLGPISPQSSYTVAADRPSLIENGPEGEGTSYPSPKNGAAASGWAVALENNSGFALRFRAYAMCAASPTEGEESQSKLESAESGQELQQVLELLR